MDRARKKHDDLSFNKPIEVDTSNKPAELVNLEIYQNLDRQSIINTFNYLFYNIRIGIFDTFKSSGSRSNLKDSCLCS